MLFSREVHCTPTFGKAPLTRGWAIAESMRWGRGCPAEPSPAGSRPGYGFLLGFKGFRCGLSFKQNTFLSQFILNMCHTWIFKTFLAFTFTTQVHERLCWAVLRTISTRHNTGGQDPTTHFPSHASQVIPPPGFSASRTKAVRSCLRNCVFKMPDN